MLSTLCRPSPAATPGACGRGHDCAAARRARGHPRRPWARCARPGWTRRSLVGAVGDPTVTEGVMLGPLLGGLRRGSRPCALAARAISARSAARGGAVRPSRGRVRGPPRACTPRRVHRPCRRLSQMCVGLALELPASDLRFSLAFATIAGVPAGAIVAEGGLAAARGRPRRALAVACAALAWFAVCIAAGGGALGPLSPVSGSLRGAVTARSCSERARPWCSASPGSCSRPRVRRNGCLVPRAEDTGSAAVPGGGSSRGGRTSISGGRGAREPPGLRPPRRGRSSRLRTAAVPSPSPAACRLQPVSCSRRRRPCSARSRRPGRMRHPSAGALAVARWVSRDGGGQARRLPRRARRLGAARGAGRRVRSDPTGVTWGALGFVSALVVLGSAERSPPVPSSRGAARESATSWRRSQRSPRSFRPRSWSACRAELVAVGLPGPAVALLACAALTGAAGAAVRRRLEAGADARGHRLPALAPGVALDRGSLADHVRGAAWPLTRAAPSCCVAPECRLARSSGRSPMRSRCLRKRPRRSPASHGA